MPVLSRQRRLSIIGIGIGGRLLACLAGLLIFGLAQAHPLLAGLEDALLHYRQLAADPATQAVWQEALPPPDKPRARKIEPGQPWAGLDMLVRRLVILGDLSADTPVPQHYEGTVVAGILVFQRRHGLEPDGVIGRATLAQLNVSPAARLRQIELNIERLRQLPPAARQLLVNVPEFVLRAFSGDTEKLRMRVIVGRAAQTRTPLFTADLRYIDFSPFWNVPRSIARRETIPKIRKDPAWFAAQGFEFVAADGIDTTLTEENLAAVLQGKKRLRQRPGPQNALGGIKFGIINPLNIYLHYTPAVRLFERTRRDLSNGCIRVEQPIELVRFVLADRPDWDADRIQAAMTRGTPVTLHLPEPLPVTIAYLTALPGADGRVSFFPDLYGLDQLQ